jgi:hypothetical protein
MWHIVIDQKSKETPQTAVVLAHTNKPTPISLKGLWLQGREIDHKWQINSTSYWGT